MLVPRKRRIVRRIRGLNSYYAAAGTGGLGEAHYGINGKRVFRSPAVIMARGHSVVKGFPDGRTPPAAQRGPRRARTRHPHPDAGHALEDGEAMGGAMAIALLHDPFIALCQIESVFGPSHPDKILDCLGILLAARLIVTDREQETHSARPIVDPDATRA